MVIGAFGAKAMKSVLKRIGWGIALLVGAMLMIDLLFPLHTELDYSPVVFAEDSTLLHAYLNKEQQWRLKTQLSDITPELVTTIIYKEDKHFFKHFGFNPAAIARAIYFNARSMKRTSGASTISMQVVRLLEPRPRNYLSKCIEIFRATQLELHHSKMEILRLYVNLLPFGSNIQGVNAASLLYFNKTPNQLSLAELTALTVIPNRPNSLRIGKDNDKIIQVRNKWLQRFAQDKLFPNNIIQDAMVEPLAAHRLPAPQLMPQFCYRMRKAYPFTPNIYTTIKAGTQLKAEHVIAAYMQGQKLKNIHNAAALIIDNATHRVISYVGSNDFADPIHFGQVDGVRAVRSPGSTLKPLVYGMAFDKGWWTPKGAIADVPISIGGYMPENYNRTFNGKVTIEYALKNSLNIPAVKLADSIGTPALINTLHHAGFNAIYKKRKQLGLSIILGGCGVTLEELAGLYTCFANNGIYKPLNFIAEPVTEKSVPPKAGDTLLSKGSASMIHQILSQLQRPDLPYGFDMAKDIPKVAWKTGTSYGRKDAWSIGYNKRFTIAVWLGNFNGTGVPDLSGANTATPLLFQLFNTIDQRASEDWMEPPSTVDFRLVCAESGMVPNVFCTNQVMDYYMPSVSNNKVCDHLKEFWLSPDKKYTYCVNCLPPNGYITMLLPNLSADMAQYYHSSHMSFAVAPKHNPACTQTFEGAAPIISFLTNGMTYLIADRETQKLQLACMAATDVQTVYWYINDQFYRATPAKDKLFFVPETTKLKISCTDDKGRISNINIKIKFI